MISEFVIEHVFVATLPSLRIRRDAQPVVRVEELGADVAPADQREPSFREPVLELGPQGVARAIELAPERFFTGSEELRRLYGAVLGADAEGVALVPSASYGMAAATAKNSTPIATARRAISRLNRASSLRNGDIVVRLVCARCAICPNSV